MLAADVLRPELAMFERTPADPSVCVPVPVHGADGACGGAVPSNIHRLEMFWSLGRVIGSSVCGQMNFALHLAPVVLQQVGIRKFTKQYLYNKDNSKCSLRYLCSSPSNTCVIMIILEVLYVIHERVAFLFCLLKHFPLNFLAYI